jgi:hypothetical protein
MKSSNWDGTSPTSFSRTWRWSCGIPTDRSRSTESPFPAVSNVLGCTAVGFLAGLVLGVPLIGAVVGGASTAVSTAVGIDHDFVREVEVLMKPGTSALFVLDSEGIWT